MTERRGAKNPILRRNRSEFRSEILRLFVPMLSRACKYISRVRRYLQDISFLSVTISASSVTGGSTTITFFVVGSSVCQKTPASFAILGQIGRQVAAGGQRCRRRCRCRGRPGGHPGGHR